jgi:photosystem II stability/assembly factor-like uncharacterized protein
MTDLGDALRNRPGLPALSYRIGDYTSFRQRLLRQLMSRIQTPDIPPQLISLEKLTTRDSDDPAIALLDAVAVVADVLTFYQERIANEGFLATATERRSVLELVRAISYELDPGVAASTVLAFTVDDNPGSPEQVIVPKGTQVLSLPGQDELPQTFETSEDLLARAEWNALQPRSTRPQWITQDTRQLYLAGLNTQLKPNDPLLLVDGEGDKGRLYLLFLAAVEPVAAAGYTRVTLKTCLPQDLTHPLRHPQVFAFRDRALLFGNNALSWNAQSNDVKRANGGTLKGGVFHLATNSNTWTADNTGLPTSDILCLTQKAAIVFAGTPGNGIFRSQQRGEPWQAVNTGLTNLVIQTLYTDAEQGHVYTGTPNGGVFRSKDDGENWSNIGTGSIRIERQGANTLSINTGLPNTVVRSLLTLIPPAIEVSTATISDASITLQATSAAQIGVGDPVTIATQTRIITRITNVNASETRLTLSSPFSSVPAQSSFILNGISVILAGTEEGIYRSADQGKNWQLTSSAAIAVHALAKIDQFPPLPGRFSSSGTTVKSTAPTLSDRLQAGDLIRIGEQVRKVVEVIPNPTLTLGSAFNPAVNAAAFSVQRQGRGSLITANGNTRVLGTDASGFQALRPNDILTVQIEGQAIARRVVEVRSGRELIVDTPFMNRPTRFSSRFSFTRQFSGIFGGITQSGQGSGVVTIANGSTRVIGNNETRFQSELLDDGNVVFDIFTTSITLVIEGQAITRRVVQIRSDRELIVDSPFVNQPTEFRSSYSFIRPATGRISSQNTTITGTGTAFGVEVQPGDLLLVNGQTSTVTKMDADVPTFTINAAFQSDLANAELSLVIFRLFAGTDSGVLRSIDFGKNWIFLNNSLGNDRDVRSLLVMPDGTIYAGTAGSQVFRLENNQWTVVVGKVGNQPITALATIGGRLIASTAGDGVFLLLSTGDRWAPLNTGILSRNVTCLSSAADLLAGTRFTGFVEDANNAGQGDWPGFEIDETAIDLDTLYPRIVPGSWVAVQSHATHTNLANHNGNQVRQVKTISTPQLSQFNLSGKVTQLELNQPLEDPAQFNRRTTTILATSELLPLVNESLTIGVQQRNIFLDPIYENTVYLKEFVAGLEPEKLAIVTGKRIRVMINDIAGVFRSSNIGESWTRSNTGLINTGVLALAQDPRTNLLYAGTVSSGVFRSGDNGQTWESIPGLPNSPIQTLTVDLNGTLFAGTSGQGVFRLVNAAWQPLPVSRVHQDIRAIATSISISGIQSARQPPVSTVNTSLSQFARVSIAINMFVGTINGGVFRSTDNGATWMQTSLNNTDVQALAIARNGQIFAGTASGQVFHSPDQGARWEPLGDDLNTLNVTTLALSSDEQFLFAGTAGSGVFRWPLHGSSSPLRWEPVNTRLTDLTIRCLKAIASNLFAGTARGGVFRSSDNGDLWAPVNAGITSLEAAINPENVVNTDVRAILSRKRSANTTALGNSLFVAGVGILVTADGLTTVPLKSGDTLHLLAPPTLLYGVAQRWQLKDKDGVTGVVITPSSQDIGLQPAAAEDPLESELVVIKTPPEDQQQPVLQFVHPIQASYDPETVRIHANVVQATHGETVREVLGSGDGAATHQSFALKKTPLTYVSAATPSGAESTLEVRVNGIRWQNAPSLYQRSPQAQEYIIRHADDGTTTVTFGDGDSGARLPSGQENVTATYRSGIGLAGLVGAQRLTLLKTRPLGISEVTNPLPTTGAADPESMTEARASAPLTVRTLDRIVSLQDYEDFARSFAGIGKAQAIALWNGENQQVHITVAAIGGGAVTPGTTLYENLVQAINTQRDPLHRVQIDSYEPLLFNLEATLLIDPDYLPDSVIVAVRTALTRTFAFEQRGFAQPVTASEAIAAMQAVPGIIAVDLDALHRRDATQRLEQLLPALPARLDPHTNQIRPAQLLVLNPAGIVLKG